MKELIKNYLNEVYFLIEEASDLKEKHNDKKIRIGTSYKKVPNGSVEYFYYNPLTEKITEGAWFSSPGSNYSYRHIGDVELILYKTPDNNTIAINRIIKPFHEDMSYANDYEERQFDNNYSEEYYLIMQEQELDEQENYRERSAIIVECINCKEKYLSIPGSNHNIELAENGKVAFLNEKEDKLLCNKCTKNKTIKVFLNEIEDETLVEEIKNYFIDFIGLKYEDMLFVE